MREAAAVERRERPPDPPPPPTFGSSPTQVCLKPLSSGDKVEGKEAGSRRLMRARSVEVGSRSRCYRPGVGGAGGDSTRPDPV